MSDPIFWERKRIAFKLLKIYLIFVVLIEPAHDKTYKIACVPIEDLDQPGHLPSLIRVFAVYSVGS